MADSIRVNALEQHVMHLKSPAATVSSRTVACNALKASAFLDEFAELREAGAIPALVALLLPSSSPLAQIAADAVWSLSSDKQSHSSIIEAGAIPLLAQQLLTHVPNLVHTAAITLIQLVDLETGAPPEMTADFVASGGIKGLVQLIPQDVLPAPSEAAVAAVSTLAALAVDSAVGDEVHRHGGIEGLVQLLRAGARAEVARHAAAALARISSNNAANQGAVREAGAIAPLVSLCADALDTWYISDADEQAAQHGAAALWILADDPECRAEILATPDALKVLASMVGGKAGAKAEGNAAGALLALLRTSPPRHRDPVSVLTADIGNLQPTMQRPEVVAAAAAAAAAEGVVAAAA